MPRRTRIKICGLRDVATLQAAVDAGADAVGLVFVEKSPRYVTAEQAAALISTLPAFVEPVGLFVDATSASILRIAHATGISTAQLHGRETPEQASELRAAGLRVIKALHFAQDRGDVIARPWRKSAVHGLLWDTPPPANTALTGGSGAAFDWDAFARAQGRHEFADLPPAILAGGLTPENVADAICVTRPYAVDVSSGVECTRGVKNAEKIAAFCHAVRTADMR